MFLYTYTILTFLAIFSRFTLAQFFSYISVVSVAYVFLMLPLFSTYTLVSLKFVVVDSVSLLLVFITMVVMLTSFYSHSFLTLDLSSALLVFLGLITSSIIVFTSGNIFLLYIAYEASLLPISYLIIKWGSYPDRGYSAMLMLLFTSVFTFPLMVLVLGYYVSYSSSLFYLASMDLMSMPSLFILWILFSFSVKLPVYGMHYWLPMAHVEAPTFGSMILAGLLLKMGGCGLVRFQFLFTISSGWSISYFMSYALMSIVVASVVCCSQADMKRLVAYSSVLHMSVILLLVLLSNSLSLSTCLFLMVFHGLSSPLLFYFVGNIYSIYKTRLLLSLRGLLISSPLLALMSTFSFLLNIPVPPLPSFLSEVLVFISASHIGVLVYLCAITMMFLVMIYNLSWFSPLTLSYSGYNKSYLVSPLGLSVYMYHATYIFISVFMILFVDLFYIS